MTKAKEGNERNLEDFKKSINEIDDQVLLNQLEILINRRRNQLITTGQKKVPIKTIAINTNTKRGKTYIVEKWWEDGKSQTKNLGQTLPDGYDLSMVMISDRARQKIGHLIDNQEK